MKKKKISTDKNEKHMHHMNHASHNLGKSEDSKKRALHRVKIIQGHVKCIEKMIEEDRYCPEIIHQSRAIQKALKQLDLLLIEDHLKTCVVRQIQDGEVAKTTEELLKLYEFK